MKKVTMILGSVVLAGFAVVANAQTDPSPAWQTSKDVQKVANKQLFEDQNLKASHINAKVMSPTWNMSKGVHRVGQTSDVGKGNVTAAVGAQDWTISKGVQQIQRKSAK